nr:MAG TPA: hypothetical protein [Ackermannviridae sp.]
MILLTLFLIKIVTLSQYFIYISNYLFSILKI